MEVIVSSRLRAVGTAANLSSTGSFCDVFCNKLAKTSGTRLDELRPLLRAEQAYVVPSGSLLALAGVSGLEPKVILKGWGCYQRVLECGQRQIFSFIVPGDLVGNWSLKQRLHTDIVAITPLLVVGASEYCRALRQVERYTAVRQVLADIELQHLGYLYDHIQRLGCQRAVERVYDLLWELFLRLGGTELHIGVDLAFPLTQEMLADALGLSSIHVNRTLQELRRDHLVTLTRGRLMVHKRRMRFANIEPHEANNSQGRPF